MKAYQEAGLTLLENDVTFQNGQFIREERLLDEGLVGNRSYRSAEDVKERRPRNIMYLGEGLVTFNDTSFPFPYRPDFFREDGELMGPADILADVYETVEEIGETVRERDSRIEEVREQASGITESIEEVNRVEREFEERFPDVFVDGYEAEDTRHDPFPHPDHVEHDYDHDWSEGSLDSEIDLSDPRELEGFFEDGEEFGDFGLWNMWIQTEAGRLFPLYAGMDVDDFGRNNLHSMSDDENYFKVSKVYHAVGFTLAENDVTFKDGVYVTDEDLKEAGVIDNTNYKNAWDVVMGRPDTVLPLGEGKLTFNNTGFSLPWAKKVFHETVEYGDITSYGGEDNETVELDLGGLPDDSRSLRGPADVLRASRKAWEEAREVSEEEVLDAMTAAGAEVDTLGEENHVDPEEIDHNYPREWTQGSIQGLPDFSEPEELLRVLDEVTEIDDVVREYGKWGRKFQDFRIEENDPHVRQREQTQEESERLRE